MSDKIIVPTLGESVTEATVSKWLKSQGEKVSADEPIVELETDKVNVEVPAPTNGVLESISVKEGETVNVGALLGMINGSAKEVSQSIKEVKDYSPPKKKTNILKEPKNMGAWNTVRNYIDRTLEIIYFTKDKVKYVGRNASASTATGNLNKHLAQQKEILEKILR